jgi:hypothetical protein
MNKSLSELETDMETKELEFRQFVNKSSEKSGCIPLHDWKKIYDFQKADDGFPFSDSKTITINIWDCSGYYSKENKTYPGMYSYAEVWVDKNNVRWGLTVNSFFGETCESDALRWANDVMNKMLYN